MPATVRPSASFTVRPAGVQRKSLAGSITKCNPFQPTIEKIYHERTVAMYLIVALSLSALWAFIALTN